MARLDCIGVSDLRAFQLGELPDHVAALVAAHLDVCRHCAGLVEQFDAMTDTCIAHLRRGTGMATPATAGTEDSLPEPAVPVRGTGGWPRPFGDYELLGELGRGGMSVVYLARQKRPARTVALKLILAGAHAAAEHRARFLAEADAIGRLQHPNIVQLYEVGECEGQLYLSLEYVAGGTLARHLHGRPQDPWATAGLVEQLARAVHYAHVNGVVHRDLKPANVLLQGSGVVGQGSARERAGQGSLTPEPWHLTPKITDFGLAKQEDMRLTASSAMLGTPAYMAPEQASGDSRRAGPAADVYALGAIFYEMLTGEPPFRAATVLETLAQARAREPVAPRQRQPRVPLDLSTICLKCLHKDPARRYASAAELADDLQRFRQGEPILARPVGKVERAVKWARCNPAVAALLATVVLVLLTGTTVGWALALDARREQTVANAERFRAETALQQAEREKVEADRERLRAEQEKTIADQERRRADEEKLRALRDKEIAQEGLMTANLARVGLICDYNPDGALALLDDALIIPPRLRDAAWGFYRAYCQRKVRTLRGSQGQVLTVAVSPDGKTLASAGGERVIRLWDTATGRELPGRLAHADFIYSLAWSPDGRTLASASHDKTVKLWDTATGLERANLAGHLQAVHAVAFSPDGNILASGSLDTTIKVWDPRQGQELFTLKGHSKSVNALAFSTDGQSLASGGVDRTIKVWDLAGGRQRFTLTDAKQGGINALAWAADGATLVSAGDDRAIRLWDMATARPRIALLGHAKGVRALAWSPDHKTLVSGSHDNSIKLWEPESGRERASLLGHANSVMALGWAPDGTRLASGGADGVIKWWNIGAGMERATLPGHKLASAIAWSPDGTTLASGGYDQTIRLWDVATGKERHVLRDMKYSVRGLAFSADGKTLAAADSWNVVTLRDGNTGEVRIRLTGHTRGVGAVAFNLGGTVLASAGEDSTVRLWDTASGRELATLALGGLPAGSVAWSPDGKTVASAAFDGTIKLWDAATGAERATVAAGKNGGRPLAWSPDGSLLAFSRSDRTVRLWDVAAGRPRATLIGHTHNILALAWSPDGKSLASGDLGSAIKLWNAATGQERANLRGHDGMVSQLVWSPDGATLGSASDDGTVKLWDLRGGQ
jgi:WD40 repeat protein